LTDFEERLRKNAESVAGIGYWSWNLVTGTVFWSEQCFRIYGRDPQTWVPTADNYHDDIFDDDKDPVEQTSSRAMADRQPFSVEYRYYKGGARDTVRWVRTDCDFMIDDDGNPLILGVSRDITVQKKTELALQESKNRFEAFADAASDWFWEMDENLRFTYMSPRAESIVGVPVSYFIGKTRRQVSGENMNSKKWQTHFEDLDARRPFRDFRFVRKGHDGRLQYVTTSGIPLFDEAGKFRGYAGASSDLTDRLEAEGKAQLAREQLAAAVNAMSESIALWDPQDRLVICNDQFRNLNQPIVEATEPGTLFQDHVQAGLDNDLYGDARGREAEWFAQRLENHHAPGQPFEVARQDGQWLLVSEQKLEDGSTITIASDITARMQQEKALRAAKQQAEFANRAKSEFLAHMSHELRTPLNAIIGFSQICESEIFGKQSHRKYVEYATDIRSASTHLLDLIADVLDLSKLEEGELTLYESIFSVEKAFDTCLKMISGRAALKQIRVDMSVDPKVDALRADERMIKQIILNLLSNAVKFTADGGHVTLKAALNRDAGLDLVVIDNGSGIDAADIVKILEPYMQARTNPDIAHEGTGLGLPIVKGLAELHGGVLSIESRIGEGTQVTVRLPAGRVVAGS